MKNGSILLFTLFTFVLGFSLGTFGSESSAPSATVALDFTSKPEVQALRTFTACVAEGKDLEALGKCTKPFFDDTLSQQQRKRILGWFLSHPQLKFQPCDEAALKKGQRKYSDAGILFVCATGEITTTPEPMAQFVLKETNGKLALLNIGWIF